MGKMHNYELIIVEGQELNGKTVKQIAGVGVVYIRLIKKLPLRIVQYISDDSDFEPSLKLKNTSKSIYSDSDSSFNLPILTISCQKMLQLVFVFLKQTLQQQDVALSLECKPTFVHLQALMIGFLYMVVTRNQFHLVYLLHMLHENILMISSLIYLHFMEKFQCPIH